MDRIRFSRYRTTEIIAVKMPLTTRRKFDPIASLHHQSSR
jgi:hypothetical protein